MLMKLTPILLSFSSVPLSLFPFPISFYLSLSLFILSRPLFISLPSLSHSLSLFLVFLYLSLSLSSFLLPFYPPSLLSTIFLFNGWSSQFFFFFPLLLPLLLPRLLQQLAFFLPSCRKMSLMKLKSHSFSNVAWTFTHTPERKESPSVSDTLSFLSFLIPLFCDQFHFFRFST